MFYLLLSVHVLLCVLLVGLVLLQQGKGADMGAAFGGGSNTVFGAGGAGSFISRLTTGTCVLFMFTSVLLVRTYQSAGHLTASPSDELSGSVLQQEAAVEPKAEGALPAPAAEKKAEEAVPAPPPAAQALPAPAGPAAK